MIRPILIFAAIFLIVTQANAQEKIAGKYEPDYHAFVSKDPNVIIAYYNNRIDKLIPFMIKGKNPFVLSDNHVGFMDRSGNIIIKPIYNNCSWFNGNYAFASISSDYYKSAIGLIDRKGNIKIPIIYKQLEQCVNGLFAAVKDGKLGFIDTNNRIIVPLVSTHNTQHHHHNILKMGMMEDIANLFGVRYHLKPKFFLTNILVLNLVINGQRLIAPERKLFRRDLMK